LEIKDPVYAAYLIFRGCKLVKIDRYCPPNPKKYIFDGSARDEPYEAEFLCAIGQGVKTTWLDFKNRMDNLQAKEDRLFRQTSTQRIDRNGKEHWLGQEVFVTSSQPVAAFLLSRGIQIHGASEIRKGNYLFAFLNHARADALTLEMLDGDAEGTWYEMKEKYKHATSLRIHFCRPNRTKREPPQLKVSGASG
jgi:hypothetical protein